MTLGLAMTPTAQLTKEKTEKLGFIALPWPPGSWTTLPGVDHPAAVVAAPPLGRVNWLLTSQA